MTATHPSDWTTDDIPDLHGRTYLVTGANSGLGRATTEHLAAHGARVVMAVRDPDRGREVLADLRTRHPDADLELRHLDLADLESVRQCARDLHDDQTPVDVLINNAGIMMTPRATSRQGIELQFAVNHLGHFALTGLLFDILRDGFGARVVTVSSEMHRLGVADFGSTDLTGQGRYWRDRAYGRSKFANVLFGLELDRRLQAAAIPVRSIVTHPGYAATNLQTTGPTGLRRRLLGAANRLVALDAATGARSQLYAATAPDARGGTYLGPTSLFRGQLKEAAPAAAARDAHRARQLWDRSVELTGVRFAIPEA